MQAAGGSQPPLPARGIPAAIQVQVAVLGPCSSWAGRVQAGPCGHTQPLGLQSPKGGGVLLSAILPVLCQIMLCWQFAKLSIIGTLITFHNV